MCGARGAGTVRVFETGADASGAVIATSLYQHLPPSTDVADSQHPGEGRKLLAFSDSRQSAAYFAPYLEDSYARLQRRRLIVQGLLAAHADEEPVAVEDVVYSARAARHQGEVLPRRDDRAAAGPHRRSVGDGRGGGHRRPAVPRGARPGQGLACIATRPGQPPKPLLSLGLTEDEAWAFIEELVRTLRQQGAVTMPESVPSNHEIFVPRLGPIRVRLSGSEPVRKVLSWMPTQGDQPTHRLRDAGCSPTLGSDGRPDRRARRGCGTGSCQRQHAGRLAASPAPSRAWAWSTRSTTSGCVCPG